MDNFKGSNAERSLSPEFDRPAFENGCGFEKVRRAARNATLVDVPPELLPAEDAVVDHTHPVILAEQPYCPIVPLGHKNSLYYFLSPSTELRHLKAEALETGRGVRALFIGVNSKVDAWCENMFPSKTDNWSQRDAGRWIIEKCNSKGVFDPNNAEIRSVGIWRDESRNAVMNCGNVLEFSDGQRKSLTEYKAKHIMIGAAPITSPAAEFASAQEMFEVLDQLTTGWGWKRAIDPDIFLGWIAAASLGGFPNWRAHIYVFGSRGSGKSKLMELADLLLGDLAGSVLNEATEAGLRQSRNNQARPILIDEFEPDENGRNAFRQDSMFGLFRRMSGGEGGRVARGGADHNSVVFRSLGSVYVTSINHIQLEPQDSSRFVMLELAKLPCSKNPIDTALALQSFESKGRSISPRFLRRMLSQSVRWDSTHMAIASHARSLGADARQADTISTILTGRDLVLFDGDVDSQRIQSLEPLLREMICDAAEVDETSEGKEAFDYLLNAILHLDHGIRRNVGELLESAILNMPIVGVECPESALNRAGIFVLRARDCIALPVGKKTPIADLYRDTKWKNGAHKSALLQLDGATNPSSAVRVTAHRQFRSILVSIKSLPFSLVAKKD